MRRRNRGSNVPVVVSLIVATAVVCGAAIALLTLDKKPKAVVGNKKNLDDAQPINYDSWTHKDLIEHLDKQGMRIGWATHGGSSPTILMRINGKNDDVSDYDWTWKYRFLNGSQGMILVVLEPSQKDAKEKSGANPNSISWGRFWFVAQDDELKKISDSLPK